MMEVMTAIAGLAIFTVPPLVATVWYLRRLMEIQKAGDPINLKKFKRVGWLLLGVFIVYEIVVSILVP